METTLLLFMIIFEITGSKVTGGKNKAHDQFLIDRVKDLEEFARPIGKSLGMSTLDSLAVTTKSDGYGFRLPSTSMEKFNTKGIQIEGCKWPSEVLKKLD